ncbi:serine/threonine-protein kinase [Actinokineospora bangkokensis]|uniref:non-specific serine/threonine protein kinase n=1 Tax=Actinokineospora bangkokensis TaxID=1193682 RepID=A0A1Q9LCQ4_9PSEU|nr:serine/threonine-protein kinase [Actinokineospora bangkokensis]OLR89799.1 hypothetical protein BJP25_01895 [Actinokineospora bangkokensis]
MSAPRIEGLRWQRFIGSGGFADVHLYRQARPRRSVAVKVLKGLEPALREQFTAEADAMVELEDHPNITPVYFTGVSDDGRHYLVMPYYPQENYADRARRGPLPVAEALSVGIQVAGAVDAAHRGGILHRDIKPANILVDKHGAPRLSDFGIAGRVGVTETGDVAMSVPWASPEVVAGHASAYTSDIYSLAATTWHLLAGRSPFEVPAGDNSTDALVRRIQDPAARPFPLPPGVPAELEKVLLRGLSRDPAHRHQAARDFALALQAVEYRQGTPTTTITMVSTPRPAEPLYQHTFGPRGTPQPEPEDLDKTAVKRDGDDDPVDEAPAETSYTPKAPTETGFRPRRQPAPETGHQQQPAAETSYRPRGQAAPETSVQPRNPLPPQGFAPLAQRPPGTSGPQGHPRPDSRPTPPRYDSGPRYDQPAPRPTPPPPPAQQPRQDTLPQGPPPQPPAEQKKPLAAIALGAVAVLAAVVTGVILFTGGGGGKSPSSTVAAPPKVVQEDVPPGKPTLVASRVDPATVRFTWTYSAQFSSDTYAWRTADGQRSGTSPTPVLTLPSPAGTPVCVQVKVVRADGSNASAEWSPQSCAS